MPHPGIPVEIRGAVLHAVRIVPEPERHRGEWHRAHELPFRAHHRTSFLVEDLNLHRKTARLDLSPPYGADRIAEDETADDVGSTRDGGQVDIALDVVVHEVEALRCKRRSR